MAFEPIEDSEIDADSPVTETLWFKVRNSLNALLAALVTNGDDHNHENGDGALIPPGALDHDTVTSLTLNKTGFGTLNECLDTTNLPAGWETSSSGAGTQTAQDAVGGVVRFIPNGGFNYQNTINKIFDLSIGDVTAEFRVKDGGASIGQECGLSDSSGSQVIAGTPVNCVGFYDNNGTSKIAVKTASASSETTTDTDLDIGANYKILKFVASSTEVNFYIDGVIKATHTTNIPSVIMLGIFGSDGSGNTDFDYARFHQDIREA